MACCLAAGLACGCNTPRTHKILTFFFDGVPEPGSDAGKSDVRDRRKTTVAAPATKSRYKEHGPYAAKQCSACHVKDTSALVLPVEELCFKCHSLDVGKKYVHGPLASGGCKVCHEPHGSIYPFLLVSEAREFCLHCHDREAVAKNSAHEGAETQCTICHDAHSSDAIYLLK